MADLSIAITISGTVANKRISYTKTSTVADVDDVMTAFCESGGGENNFFSSQASGQGSSTIHTYDGMSAVMVVALNTNGLSAVSLVGSLPSLTFCCPSGFPLIAFNGGGFNGMFNQSSTATDSPDQDPEVYTVSPIGGRNKFGAIGALKAIS